LSSEGIVEDIIKGEPTEALPINKGEIAVYFIPKKKKINGTTIEGKCCPRPQKNYAYY